MTLSNALKRSNFDKVEREAEIMSHAFFADLDWEDLQEQSSGYGLNLSYDGG